MLYLLGKKRQKLCPRPKTSELSVFEQSFEQAWKFGCAFDSAICLSTITAGPALRVAWGAGSHSSCLGVTALCRATERLTAIHTYRRLSVDSLPNACEMWEEFGVAAVNPCRHRERQRELWHLPKSLLVDAKYEFTIWDTAVNVCKIVLHDCWKIAVKVDFMASKATWYKK